MHLAPAWRLSSRRRQHVFVVLTQGPAGRARLGGVDLVRDRHLVGRLTSMLAIARSSSPLDANPRSSRVVALSFPVGPTPAAMLRPPCINRSATRLVRRVPPLVSLKHGVVSQTMLHTAAGRTHKSDMNRSSSKHTAWYASRSKAKVGFRRALSQRPPQ